MQTFMFKCQIPVILNFVRERHNKKIWQMADEFVSQLARRSYLYKIEFQWQKNPDAIFKTMNMCAIYYMVGYFKKDFIFRVWWCGRCHFCVQIFVGLKMVGWLARPIQKTICQLYKTHTFPNEKWRSWWVGTMYIGNSEGYSAYLNQTFKVVTKSECAYTLTLLESGICSRGCFPHIFCRGGGCWLVTKSV